MDETWFELNYSSFVFVIYVYVIFLLRVFFSFPHHLYIFSRQNKNFGEENNYLVLTISISFLFLGKKKISCAISWKKINVPKSKNKKETEKKKSVSLIRNSLTYFSTIIFFFVRFLPFLGKHPFYFYFFPFYV
jgi:hypothetical protein